MSLKILMNGKNKNLEGVYVFINCQVKVFLKWINSFFY